MTAFLALGLMGSIPGCGQEPREKVVRFNILQLSDIYEFEPVDQGSTGGLARVAALKKELLRRNDNTYAMLSGDLVSPSPMARVDYEGEKIAGRQMVDVMNLLELDFATFGNHEFDLDRGQLHARLRESKARWVSTNTSEVTETKKVQPFEFAPRHRLMRVVDKRTKKSVVVALIGLTTNANRSQDYVQYEDPIASANRKVNELTGQYDVLIALTHQSLDNDKKLAKAVPEINLILGGHDGRVYVPREETCGAPIFKSDFNARAVWVHNCTFDVTNRTLTVAPTLTPIEDQGREDDGKGRNRMLRRIDKWYDRFARGLRNSLEISPTELVGHVPEGKDLDGREEKVRSGPTNLTRLIGQSMIEALNKKVSDDHSLKNEVKALPRLAIFNSGMVRLDDMLRPGPITTYDVLRMLPFPEEMIRGVTMSRNLAEKLLGTRSDPHYRGNGWFLQVFVFDKDGKPFVDKSGKPSSDDKLPGEATEFLVAVNSYLIDGNERGFAGVVKEHVGDEWGFSLKEKKGEKGDGWQDVPGLQEVQSSVEGLIEYLRTNPKLDVPDETDEKGRAGCPLGLDGFDLQLMPNDAKNIRKKGRNLIVMALVDEVLCFRVFNGNGRIVVDTDEKKRTEKARQIKDLRCQLEGLWPPHDLTESEKDKIHTALTSILAPLPLDPIMIKATGTNKDPDCKEDCDRCLHLTGPKKYAASIITNLEEAIEEPETDGRHRLILAESLIHLEPESRLAANEIVEKFRSRDLAMKREAERILSEAVKPSPPGLIRAILPLLDLNPKSQVDSEFLRADVAELLSKVDPKVLAREKGGDEAGRARAANTSR
ncbi:MAG: bifunctional metallophosphatase/5'-nucleotidase [Acidimicrobiales bacterium]